MSRPIYLTIEEMKRYSYILQKEIQEYNKNSIRILRKNKIKRIFNQS